MELLASRKGEGLGELRQRRQCGNPQCRRLAWRRGGCKLRRHDSHAILEALRRRGMKLYLASGTHLHFVQAEADLLEISLFFGNEINAPHPTDLAFSKRAVIERILDENQLQGEELLSFGDGVVETEEVRRVGGTAIAVASDETPGGINRWKRDRLVPAGADVVIADYRRHEQLLAWLFDEDKR
jgi:phosphoglycolate phosphatase-like HAD superfamily hydrolase